ncbi:MAG: hypothetical protein K0B87_00420 [Candidatus Syntrophosphaera sp.]|nr:hypothetical protein [Candidatus Syntrophosphaera sp.]
MKAAFFVVLLIAAGALAGTVHIVNNTPDTDPDFTTLSAAYTAAAPGDTLYICGSLTSYGDLNLQKQLTLIGAGYFLTENPFTQANPHSSKLNTLQFSSGSAGSLASGLQANRMYVNASNITLKRNFVNMTSYDDAIYINTGASNVAVVQNYVSRAGVSYTTRCLNAVGNNYSLYIANNFFVVDGSANLNLATTSFATIEHNVFHAVGGNGNVTIYNSIFQNNIMRSGNFTANATNTVLNNIGNATQFGTANGNQSNVDMATVFTLSGSTDGMYMLLPGSPAIGAGVGGADCGMYGGPAPYVLSGMPEGIPSIYEFTAPASGFTLPALIKAHAH